MQADDQRQHMPYALNQDEGWTYRFGVDFIVKASEVAPESGSAVLEYVTRHGEEPEAHSHPTEDEMFVVLDGQITFHCGGKDFPLRRGGFVFLPRGIKHGYTIHGDDPVRLLAITAPAREGAQGGWGGFVSEMEQGQAELVAKPPHLA
jgi:quercetin dioxygenase-like cupin family protein